MMETVKLEVLSDADSLLRLILPVSIPQKRFEVLVVMQPVNDEAVDAMGYPIGYFDETYGICADDPIERGEPLAYEVRDELV